MKSLFVRLAMAAVVMCGAPAHAVLVQQTYTGSVASGADIDGVFGPGGTDLAGRAFTAVFVFDTTRGNAATGAITPGSGSFVQLAGGTSGSDPFLGAPTPLISASLSLAGSGAITIATGLEDRTAIRSSANLAAAPSEYLSAGLGINGDLLTMFVRSFSATYPPDLAEPGTYLASLNAVVGGQFRIVNATTFTDSAGGLLVPSMVTVSVVPEPGAAFLMAAGLVGLLFERRVRDRTALQRADSTRSQRSWF